jgi:hypothetical protein
LNPFDATIIVASPIASSPVGDHLDIRVGLAISFQLETQKPCQLVCV